VLSNFRLTRKTGLYASGAVTIILSSNTTTVIPTGAEFTANSLTFVTPQSYLGSTTNTSTGSTTVVQIYSLGNDLYGMDIELTAAEKGSEYQLSQGTTLQMTSPPTNFVSATTKSDFSMGSADETNTEMIQRLANGISGRTLATRAHVKALVTDMFPNVIYGSVIGFGEPEMQRDKNNIFKTSYGGKSDIYLQTATRPTNVIVTKTATLVSSLNKKWQMHFDRDEFAGVYKIVSVKPVGSVNLIGTLQITYDTRTINVSAFPDNAEAVLPTITTYSQGAFSRFQEATIEFFDPNTNTTGLTEFTSTQSYEVTLLTIPDIAAIQDRIISSGWLSSHRYDDIVKAPIPCLVSITLAVRIPKGSSFNVGSAKSAISAGINALGFTDTLSSSSIIDAIQSALPARGYVAMPIDMLGEVIDPENGASVFYRSSNSLKVPTEYSKSISSTTAMFFNDPNDIDIYTELF